MVIDGGKGVSLGRTLVLPRYIIFLGKKLVFYFLRLDNEKD